MDYPTPNFLEARQTRRDHLKRIGSGLLLAALAPKLYGQTDPQKLRLNRTPLSKLTTAEAGTLDALGDTLLPGAAEAGITHYVDTQLASDAPLLILRYLDFPMPLLEFYQTGLAALENSARQQYQKSFADLTDAQRTEWVAAIAQANPAGWNGPPAPLFYFTTRNDAVDVYYGTQDGFEKLAIPYMPHIAPAQPW